MRCEVRFVMDCQSLSERDMHPPGRLFICSLGKLCIIILFLAEIHVELSNLKSKLKSLERGGSGTKSFSGQRLKHGQVVLDSLQNVAKAHTAAFQVRATKERR